MTRDGLTQSLINAAENLEFLSCVAELSNPEVLRTVQIIDKEKWTAMFGIEADSMARNASVVELYSSLRKLATEIQSTVDPSKSSWISATTSLIQKYINAAAYINFAAFVEIRAGEFHVYIG